MRSFHSFLTFFIAVLLLGAVAGDAVAHVTLETTKAPAGSFYKAVFGVPHGCEGSATTAIRVKIPEGVISVKPMPKTGWKLTTKEGEYANSYEFYGRTLTRGVVEVAWTGGNLPDAWFNEFTFVAKLPDAPVGTKIYFPVVQECVEGTHHWVTIPAEGKDSHDYAEPAPGLTLTEPSH